MSLVRQLGLQITPDEVRLIVKPRDLYRWNITNPNKAYIFEKHMSKHSIGAHMELCRGVGHWFTATLLHADQSSPSPRAAPSPLMPDLLTENSISTPLIQSGIDAETELKLEILQTEVKEWRRLYDSETKRREEQEMGNQTALANVANLEMRIKQLEERLELEKSEKTSVTIAFKRLLPVVENLQQLATDMTTSREAFIGCADIQKDEIETCIQFAKGHLQQ